MLVNSAIAYKGEGVLFIGKRHSDCIQAYAKVLSQETIRFARSNNLFTQGFVDENNNFYTRIAAKKYALEIGQVSAKKLLGRNEIFSEDLW